MIDAYDARSVRAAEEPLLARGEPLMERAAFALAEVVARELRARRGSVAGGRVVVLAGAGNNGGDALLAGARLAGRGVAVTVVRAADAVHEAGLGAVLSAGGRSLGDPGGPWDQVLVGAVAGADVVLDGILGNGASGGLREPARSLVTEVARAVASADGGGPVVVAVDLPSGIGVDDGTVPGPVLRADVTVSFGALKSGLLLPPAADLAGRVEVVDLGLALPLSEGRHGRASVQRLTPADVVGLGILREPDASAQKYTRGVLGVVAGTRQYPGAAVLTVSAAVRTGTGMVRYLGGRDVTASVLAARPEVVPAPGRVQAWAVGPGIASAPTADDDATRSQQDRVRHALAQAVGEAVSDVAGGPVPAVVDAGGLALLPGRCPPWVVLTPHAGELAELLRSRGERVERTDVEAEPVRWVRRARDLTGATVLLKGGVTLVAGPDTVLSQADGPAWLSTAGAGDVLTGILGALLAAHSEAALKDPAVPSLVAAAAALVHGRAAHRANPGGPVSALDVAEAVPGVVADLLAGDA
jgi:ADP-dependent NAD(P)H-hydrate dehydratase / NAD(P)H-hydrate epimerase